MGLFDEVKQNVTVRQAAERYGLKPNRSGLIRCIFHNDKSPSMKVDRRYYCFGCGCTGDAIDFTAQLFDIGLKDAAMKLADDFGIPYSGRDRGSPQNRRSVSAKKPEPTPEELWQKKHLRCLRAYLDYLSLLLEWKECYAPKTPEEEWDGHFVTALRELGIVEYYLDILLFGDEEDKKMIVKEKGKEVEKIERKCKGEGRFAGDGADGGCGCHKGDSIPSGGDKSGNRQRDDAELYDRAPGRPAPERESEI